MSRVAVYLVGLALLAGACGGGGGTDVAEISVGDCFDDPSEFIVETLDVVDCDEPHDNEVYAKLLLEQSAYPSDDVITQFALDVCLPPFEAYVGETYAESPLDFSYLAPTEDGWNNRGERSVTCFLYSADLSRLTGSVRADS